MLIAVIEEGVACSTESFRQNEADSVSSAEFVHFGQVLDAIEVLSVAHHVVVLVIIESELLEHSYLDIGIQLLELVEACCST